MRAGRLDKYGYVQTPTETRTGTGAQTTSWANLFDAWARIEPVRGREFWDGQTVEVEHWVRITMWYNPAYAVTEAMSFLYGSTRYLFRDVSNVNMGNHTLEIMAVERA